MYEHTSVPISVQLRSAPEQNMINSECNVPCAHTLHTVRECSWPKQLVCAFCCRTNKGTLVDQMPQIIIDYFALHCVADKSQLFSALGFDPTLRYHKKTFMISKFSTILTCMYCIDSQKYWDTERGT